MAGLSGYCPESSQEREQRLARERAEAEKNRTNSKEKN